MRATKLNLLQAITDVGREYDHIGHTCASQAPLVFLRMVASDLRFLRNVFNAAQKHAIKDPELNDAISKFLSERWRADYEQK